MASWQAHKPADVGSSPAAPFMANGGVAQKEERGASNSVVAGSSPAAPNALRRNQYVFTLRRSLPPILPASI
jgi:hypothetical protein